VCGQAPVSAAPSEQAAPGPGVAGDGRARDGYNSAMHTASEKINSSRSAWYCP
jgi:hypothetical protein